MLTQKKTAHAYVQKLYSWLSQIRSNQDISQEVNR